MQSTHLITDLAHFHNSQRCGAVLTHKMLGDIPWHILLENQKVFVLLVDRGRVLDESIAELSSAVRADKVEVEGLALLVLQVLFESVRVLLQDAINCLLSLGSIRCPLAAHQTDQAVRAELDNVIA